MMEWDEDGGVVNTKIKNANIHKYDDTMMDIAIIWAKRSYCKRRQVGAVLAKDDRVISTGYNGTISGMSNDCEEKCEECNGRGYGEPIDETATECKGCRGKGIVTNDFTLHAEQNVIAYAAKNGISINGCTLYVTMSPCSQCAKLIAQSGITRVIYKDKYSDISGIEFLGKLGVIVDRLKG